MDKFIIKGGVPLKGEIKISGAKNAALPLMAACLLVRKNCRLKNIPHLTDIVTMGEILKNLGVKVERNNEELNIDSSNFYKDKVPYKLGSKIRASILTLGPLLACLGHAQVSLPGGCKIGKRPIDIHLKGLKEMGARIKINDNYIEASAPRGLKGSKIYLSFPSVGATENIILAASLTPGTTIIRNASRNPEIIDLVKFLKNMGAKIEGEGTNLIKIQGTKEIHPIDHSVIPDRIETGTFILAGIITGGKIIIKGVCPEHLKILLVKLKKMGAKIDCEDRKIKICGGNSLFPIEIKTLPYPGFPTDLQPQMTALSCFARGTSTITETIFENRFACVPELQKMGAIINKIEKTKIKVKGVSSLKGASLTAHNIQEGIALVLAGLSAEGITEIGNVFHIDRGYENLEKKLSLLGAQIKRIREN